MTPRRSFLTAIASAAVLSAVGTSQPARAQALQRASVRVKTKDGTELYVKDWGSGRPVIFVHGWPLNADMWDYQALQLASAGFRAIAYDRRGFGRSSQPSGGYDYDTLTDDLAAVVQATGARDAILVGYSMGGGEVVRYMSRHKGRNVAKIALVGAIVPGLLEGPNNPKGIPAAEFEGIKAGLRKDRATFLASVIKDVIYDISVPSTTPVTAQVLDWTNHMAMQASLRALVASVDLFGKTDFRGDLAAVKVPALILHGTADKPVPYEITAKAAAAGITKSKLVEYKGVSHGLVLTEQARVARDLAEFVSRG